MQRSMLERVFLVAVFTLAAPLSALSAKGLARTEQLLPRSTPERQGVSSAKLLKFITAADAQFDGMHGFVLVRHGHVVAEGWWAPYDAETPHMLYSLSKSFTSTAVGLAVAEGKLSLDDKVIDFFPDEAPKEPSRNLRSMRMRDLLRMSTGHENEPALWRGVAEAAKNDTWTKRFLTHPVPFKPGTHFRYNTSATYMQSAMVQKATGQKVLDYLRPRLLDPLGFKNVRWMESPEGVSVGGFGGVKRSVLKGVLEPSSASVGRDQVAPFLGAPAFSKQRLFDDQRYPNVVVTVKGTVLAVWGNSGVVVRRSEDGGKSWGQPIQVARAGYHGGGTIVDANSGDILIFVEDRQPPAPLTLYRSQDDARTWHPQHTVIEKDVNGNRPSMHMNEHGVTLVRGLHKGRLLRPSRYYGSKGGKEQWPQQYTNAIYSDDGGKTWKTSDPFPEKGTGEAALVELADGRIYYNSRVHWSKRPRNRRRREAWSDDGGASWKNWRIVDVLPDGDQGRSYGCMGGLTRLPLRDRDILIFSNLDTEASHRERVTVWASFDGGRTWPIKRLVDGGRSGYSSLAVGRPGTPTAGWIYLHYEHDPIKGSHVARFNLAWILGGQRTGNGEVPHLRPQ